LRLVKKSGIGLLSSVYLSNSCENNSKLSAYSQKQICRGDAVAVIPGSAIISSHNVNDLDDTGFLPQLEEVVEALGNSLESQLGAIMLAYYLALHCYQDEHSWMAYQMLATSASTRSMRDHPMWDIHTKLSPLFVSVPMSSLVTSYDYVQECCFSQSIATSSGDCQGTQVCVAPFLDLLVSKSTAPSCVLCPSTAKEVVELVKGSQIIGMRQALRGKVPDYPYHVVKAVKNVNAGEPLVMSATVG